MEPKYPLIVFGKEVVMAVPSVAVLNLMFSDFSKRAIDRGFFDAAVAVDARLRVFGFSSVRYETKGMLGFLSPTRRITGFDWVAREETTTLESLQARICSTIRENPERWEAGESIEVWIAGVNSAHDMTSLVQALLGGDEKPL